MHVTRLVLYRECITKGPLRLFGGYSRAIRSMRASWAAVTVSVDGHADLRLRQGVPHPVDVPPGQHRIQVHGSGFAPGHGSVEVQDGTDLIVAVTPAWLDGVGPASPLGELRIRPVGGPEQLQPFEFYRELPTSIGRTTVAPSVLVSIISSAVFLTVFGLIPVAFAFYFLTRGWQYVPVFAFLMALSAFMGVISIPAGFGGLLIAYRFIRLPASWRAPERTRASAPE